MADFFIRRPIVAIVISIIIVMMGLFTLKNLSFEQYPFLAPPTIRVTGTYPGASAVAVEQSASLSPAAAEKQRGVAGQGGVTTTTPPPEPSPQTATPQPPATGAATPRPASAAPAGAVKTLKCGDCGTLNRPTEWYCERCGAELAAL